MTVDPAPGAAEPTRASVIAKQVGVVFLGFLLAAVMVGLGLWQLGVYNAQGHQQAVERAAAPPVALESVARPGQEVGDAYGRQVRFSGSYDPRLQVLVSMGSGNRFRVLTGLLLDGGGILPVVRGAVIGNHPPTPPTGRVSGSGIFMPSEASDTAGARPGAPPTSVVLPSLAQQWNGSLINGFVTLGAEQSRAQSLEPVTVDLPSSHGRLQNGFYAIQWWVFAAFAIWMSFRIAADIRRGGLMGSDPDVDSGQAAAEPAMSPPTVPRDTDSSTGDTTT